MGLDRYRFLMELGRGGMGVVNLAEDQESGQQVAIKVVRPGAEAEDIQRFLREARALEDLDHPHIVSFRESGVERGQAYLVMDHIAGPSLREVFRENARFHRPLERDRIIELFSAIGGALAACHERGLIHRDLKPSNIMIEAATGRPVLIDFGLNKTGDGESLTRTGEVLGTPAYMAPEQIDSRSFGALTQAADLWSLGVILYEALTGVSPFRRSSALGSIQAIVQRDFAPLDRIDGPLDPGLVKLCQDCMALPPSRRPSAAEFVAALPSMAQAAARTRSPLRARLAALVVGLSALTALIGLALVAPSAPPVLVSEPELWFSQSDASLEVQASGPRRLRLARARGEAWRDLGWVESDARGRFRFKAELTEAESRFRLASDAGALIVTAHLDRDPPRIRLRGGAGLEASGKTRLQGRVDDRAAAVFSVAGREVTLDGGSFDLSIETPVGPITCRAVDRAGNRTTLVAEALPAETFLPFLEASGAEDLPSDLAALADRETWTRLSEDQQDRAIAAAKARLGAGFEHRATRTFRCGPISHRLAVFRHQRSAIDLVLAPGGVLPRTVTTSEELRRAAGASYEVFRRHRNGAFKSSYPPLSEAASGLIAFDRAAPELRYVRPMLIGRDEVSQAQWLRFSADPGWKWGGAPGGPADLVTSAEVAAWLESAGGGLRIPEEGEWEFAYRAGSKSFYYWGDTFDPGRSNGYLFNYRPAAGERSFLGNPYRRWVQARGDRTNAFGLFDMAGDAWELTATRLRVAEASGPGAATVEELQRLGSSASWAPGTEIAVYRGGNWFSTAVDLHAGSRFGIPAASRGVGRGFRVVRSLVRSDG